MYPIERLHGRGLDKSNFWGKFQIKSRQPQNQKKNGKPKEDKN